MISLVFLYLEVSVGFMEPNHNHTILITDRTEENRCRLCNKLRFWVSLIPMFNTHLSYLYTSNKFGISWRTLTLLSNESNKNNKQS